MLALAVAAYVPFGDPTGPGAHGTRALPLLLLTAAALPARRRFPVPVLAGTVLVAVTAVLIGLDTPVFVLPVAVAVWSLADGDRRIAIVLGAVTAVVMPFTCVIGAPPGAWLRTLLGSQAMQLAAIIAFACAAGLAVESRRAALRAYADRAERAEETREAEARRRVAEERLAIARDLHDSVAHQMAVINLHSGLAVRTLRGEPDRAEASLSVVEEAARAVLTEIGGLLSALRNPDAAGARISSVSALDPRTVVDRFRANGVIVDASLDDCDGLDPEITAVVLRVVQEALTNAAKHGDDDAVLLEVRRSADTVTIRAVNTVNTVNGTAGSGWGQGLRGARERVRAVRGEFHASGTERRFELVATIPTGDEAPGGGSA